jgi:hypothetical protein
LAAIRIPTSGRKYCVTLHLISIIEAKTSQSTRFRSPAETPGFASHKYAGQPGHMRSTFRYISRAPLYQLGIVPRPARRSEQNWREEPKERNIFRNKLPRDPI